jgi:hypothetical protein
MRFVPIKTIQEQGCLVHRHYQLDPRARAISWSARGPRPRNRSLETVAACFLVLLRGDADRKKQKRTQGERPAYGFFGSTPYWRSAIHPVRL